MKIKFNGVIYTSPKKIEAKLEEMRLLVVEQAEALHGEFCSFADLKDCPQASCAKIKGYLR